MAMADQELDAIDELEIEPLSDEALEAVAGGSSSDGPVCCSCKSCSNTRLEPVDTVPSA
jgi:hypothetical protein